MLFYLFFCKLDQIAKEMNAEGHLSLVVFRHPFARLASAYFNKFFVKRKPKWKEHIQSAIANYRLPETEYREDEALPEEFLRHVLEELRSSKKYQNIDTHWRPQHIFCAYCVFNYSVYSKVLTNQNTVLNMC